MTAISVRNLVVRYDDALIIEHLNLEIPSGSFCTIVGASGCGKSSFLRIILGQDQPFSGEILLDGETISPEPSADRGIVFQRYSVFPHLTAEENLIVPQEIAEAPILGRFFGAKRRRAQARARSMLEQIGLGVAADRYPSQLSGGMQQRLALAQALVKRPKILLLDEPFGALDPGIRADMHELLLGLWRDHSMTVLLVTHDVSEAFALGTRVLVFDKIRHDPHEPNAYGATVTFDLPLDKQKKIHEEDPTSVPAV